MLPFVLARIFRPTFLDVFGLSNFQLGVCFSIYGTVALLSYLWGGAIADRYKPRTLMALALFLTGLGGFVMATFPSYGIMKLLFGYWGFVTVFLFWGAMIKATRVWGGEERQGRAFGFLDGGRGLVAAGIGSLGVLIFAIILPEDISLITSIERQEAFQYVILFATGLVILVAVLVLIFLQSDKVEGVDNKQKFTKTTLRNFKILLKIPAVWWLMLIVLCAYVGYKTTDILSLYANKVMLYNEVESAKIGTFLLYLRPIIGISIGFMADKSRASLLIIIGFIMMFLGALLFASGIVGAQVHYLFFFSLIITALGVYAIRALYFATMQAGAIPLAMTGAAIGLISFVGYTPDIFMGPLTGILLDNSPGKVGHQHVFMVLASFSAIGLLASIAFHRITKSK